MKKKAVFFTVTVLLLAGYAAFVSYLFLEYGSEDYRDYPFRPAESLSRFRLPDNSELNSTLMGSIVMSGDYLMEHIEDSGRWDYEYNASAGESNGGYNVLRHGGTTYSLALAFKYGRDTDHYNGTIRTMNYLLSRYLEFEIIQGQEVATISAGSLTKLGGPALALMGLMEIRSFEPDNDDYDREIKALKGFLVGMQRPNGSFQCYFGDREEQHSDYYPGEALLALAKYHRVYGGQDVIDALRSGIGYYNDHFSDGYTAYSPWATEAIAYLYHLEGGPHLKEKAYSMADSCARGQKVPGRVVDPFYTGAFSYSARSSTASRVEAVCDAYLLAKRIDDTTNSSYYRYCMDLCGGFLMRLQIDEEDAANLPQPERALGGIPNSRYDLTIRIDNVQHTIVVLAKIMVYQVSEDHI